MDYEDDEWVEVLKRLGLEGKHFEAKGVSRGEFEALKRFGVYKELVDGTLMRIEDWAKGGYALARTAMLYSTSGQHKDGD